MSELKGKFDFKLTSIINKKARSYLTLLGSHFGHNLRCGGIGSNHYLLFGLDNLRWQQNGGTTTTSNGAKGKGS